MGRIGTRSISLDMAKEGRGTGMLDVPAELRLLMYEHLLQDPVVSVSCSADGRNKTRSTCWSLLQVKFHFSDVNEDAMFEWCQRMGPERICQMRKISMNGLGTCVTGCDEVTGVRAEAPSCRRTITLDLDDGFESPYTKERLEQDKLEGFFVPPQAPYLWQSLRAFQSDEFCQRGCLGCRYCIQLVAVGRVSKMEWTSDGEPIPTADLILDLVDTTTKDISVYLCPQGCGIDGCNHHRGELNTGGSTDAFLQLLRLRDYNERYLVA